MSTRNLGKVSITPGGRYSGSTQYQPLTMVNHNGNAYLSMRTVSGIAPGVDSNWDNYWMFIGGKGDTGNGLKILGYYASVDALRAAVPNPSVGDAYGVGTSGAYNIYTWTSGGTWSNLGPANANSAVLYVTQSLSTAEKTQASSNIGAVMQVNGVEPTGSNQNVVLSASDISAVPTTRTINGYNLSANRTLRGNDVKCLSLFGQTALEENDDLDNYTTEGNYYAGSAVVSTLANCPVSTAFRLDVTKNLASTNYIFQDIRTYTGQHWRRILSQGAVYKDWMPIGVAVNAGTVTAGTNITLNTSRCYRQGNIVTLYLSMTAGANISSGATVATIPSDVAPSTTIYIAGSTGGSSFMSYSLNSSGNVAVRSAVTNSSTLQLCASYYIA